ncbi:alpha/beta-hydrolase [Hortaea werneckii]|nr:alpha/beta-hydrolase [Hortaea werneckii]
MALIPFLSRLHPREYLALTLSFTLLALETILRSITLLLPTPIIRFFYHVSRNAFNTLSSPYSRRARQKKRGVTSPLAQAQDFVELCELQGYVAEEHIVQTKDGYLLGLHRVVGRQGSAEGQQGQRVNSGEGSVGKKVVYMHHGLLMNSEVWVCLTDRERCLPFVLVEQGYDVWLGNNRGNKYSKKSVHSKPTEARFWDFSMDQFAFHDIPDSINYILETTRQPNLSYIGFSQGTAQAFATLSIHPTLNEKVNLFIALAPAMAPPGLASGTVASLCKSNPEVLFLAFGRRAILGSATMWQALLYPAIFTWFIDKSLAFLFNWQTRNISPHQKLAAYPHLYSFTSTKCVVHWFQIIRNGTFQMFDDETTTPFAVGNSAKYYKVAKFPTRNIKTPIHLIYGGSDSLVDIKLMLKELPRHTVARGIQKYEHLDLLWASDVNRLVFPHVLEALEMYTVPTEKSKEATAAADAASGWKGIEKGITERRMLQNSSPLSTNGSHQPPPPGYSETERAGASPSSPRIHRARREDLEQAEARGQAWGLAAAWQIENVGASGSSGLLDAGYDEGHNSSAGDALDETDVDGSVEGEEGYSVADHAPAVIGTGASGNAGMRLRGAANEVRLLPPDHQISHTSFFPHHHWANQTKNPSLPSKPPRQDLSRSERRPTTTAQSLSPSASTTTTDGPSTVRPTSQSHPGRRKAVEGWWSSTASSEVDSPEKSSFESPITSPPQPNSLKPSTTSNKPDVLPTTPTSSPAAARESGVATTATSRARGTSDASSATSYLQHKAERSRAGSETSSLLSSSSRRRVGEDGKGFRGGFIVSPKASASLGSVSVDAAVGRGGMVEGGGGGTGGGGAGGKTKGKAKK